MSIRMEYTQDKLRAEIRRLENLIDDMQREQHKHRTATMVAEILLCVVTFLVGVIVGTYL